MATETKDDARRSQVTEADIAATMDLSLRLSLTGANFHSFRPLPGTRSGGELMDEGLIEDWVTDPVAASMSIPKTVRIEQGIYDSDECRVVGQHFTVNRLLALGGASEAAFVEGIAEFPAGMVAVGFPGAGEKHRLVSFS